MTEIIPDAGDSSQRKGPNPILVGGENRSGTTLMGIMLDSHPDVVMGSEIDFVSPSFEKIRNNIPGEAEERFLRQLGRFGVTRDDVLGLLYGEEKDRVPLTHRERCLFMLRVGHLKAETSKVDRWGFQIQRQIGNAELINLSLPSSQFVHVVRDGRDVAASHLKLNGKSWAYKNAEEAAQGWSSLVRRIKEVEDPIITEVRYEDLVLKPEATLGALLGNLALTWSDEVMRYNATPHALLDTPANHPSADQVRYPLYTHSIGAYEHILSKDDIRTFERVAGEELELFGYK